MAFVDINGHPTWMTVGEPRSETVLMLHGGLSDSDMLVQMLGASLAETYRIAAFDRRGHGRTADTPEPFHYESMADETIAVIEQLATPVHVVGWSDGGNVGLLAAMRRPDLVRRLVLIGANFHHNGVRPLVGLNPDSPLLAMIGQRYADISPDGAGHFSEFVGKALEMITTEPVLTTADLATVALPVLVMVGDDDLIELSHTVALYESIPGAQLAVVPGTSHALPMEQPEITSRIIARFLAADLTQGTFMPSRRLPQ